MAKTRVEQHIAVFGESGSGKTVLVSSFYGATQQQAFKEAHPYSVIADSQSQHRQLLSNYLGMRGSATLPDATRFRSYEYAFTVMPDVRCEDKKQLAIDRMSVVWHDYPGEWLTEDVDASEAEDRLATFHRLMKSDVALILIDGQRLLDHAREEERYLKSVLANINHGLHQLRDDVTRQGKIATFPRIWMFALSKCDLLPEVTAPTFRDMMIEKAAFEIGELETTLRGYVTTPELLNIGEDYVTLSAAKFEPGKIDLAERVGVDLMLPIAAVLPMERFLRWANRLASGQKFLLQVGAGNSTVISALMKGIPIISTLAAKRGKTGLVVGAVLKVGAPAIERVAANAAEKLSKAYAATAARKDALGRTLTEFRQKLDRAEERRELVRSPR